MTQQEIDQSRAAGQAAGHAAAAAAASAGLVAVRAIGAAAENAAKPGWWSSEFKATVFGILVAGGVAALHALAVIPSPIMPAAIAITAGLTAASYSISRGNVKAAALAGAAAAATSLAPAQAGAIETGRAITAAIIGAEVAAKLPTPPR